MSRPAWRHLLGILGGLLVAVACGWIIDRPGMCASLYLAGVLSVLGQYVRIVMLARPLPAQRTVTLSTK